MATCQCRCGYNARNRKSLSKHRSQCGLIQGDIDHNVNILLSRGSSSGCASIGVNRDGYIGGDDCGNDNGSNYIYDFHDNNIWPFSASDTNEDTSDVESHCDDFMTDDDHSATISSAGDGPMIYDEFNGEQNSTSSSAIDRDDDSSSSSQDSFSNSSLSCEDESELPGYDPPMFSTTPLFSAAYKLQIELHTLFDKNKASLTMYDEMVKLFNGFFASNEFSKMTRLSTRKKFMAETEKLFGIAAMKPTYGCVRLEDNTVATVPVFDAKAMILSLLHDPSIMKHENFAPGYDIFTGDVLEDCECNQVYGEIHTGDAWIPARNQHCGKGGKFMPIALVLFGDKSHTDLHGSLSVEPVSFTLTLFNRDARNLPKFWRLLGYIPNLTAGKGEANRQSAKDKLQNLHNCLSYVLKSIRDINESGGIRTTVMGQNVHTKVWIHFIIGDCEGNNKWLGHYPGNNSGTARPYRDCECSFSDMCNTNPTCMYTTLREMAEAQSLLQRNKKEGSAVFQQMSRYIIRNALLQPGLPMSDQIYGAYRMTPPELLHTSGAGLILYMFRSIAGTIGAGIGRDDLDRQHVRMMQSIQRQSERDFPRGTTRNGIVDGTKCQASERRGNLFSLTCIAHTHDGLILKEEMKLSDDKWRSLKLFLRQYLAMEEWFHSDNNKLEVQNARRKIAKVLKMLQELFPRGEGTNGYNIPKMHGMTKMQSYMMRFGCAMNFFGGTGESSHKQFVKAPGQKTQRRVSEFAHQTAKQYHHVMVTHHALTCMTLRGENNSVHDTAAMMHDRIVMEGKYTIHTSGGWMEDNTLRLNNNLLGVYLRDHAEISQNNTITGYTHARIFDKDGIQSIFYAHPTYRSGPWYDWAFVHFLEGEEELYYPSRVLGFVETLEGVEAVIQCSVRPMKWTTVEKKMLVAFDLGDKDESFVRVPLSSFVHTLCVIRDYGGEKNKYFVVLPKRGWGCYFGKDIMKSSNEY
jgi:hypothetical protein